MVPVTSKTAVIVAHGSPSDPAPHERAVQGLAEMVESLLPGWQIRGCTLAAPGRFEAVLEGLDAPMIYPFFMASGWFTETYLVGRIGNRRAKMLTPFGVEPKLLDLAADCLRKGLAEWGWDAPETTLLVAAHGNARRPKTAISALRVGRVLGRSLGFRDSITAFIEQQPLLEDCARNLGQAICVSFFALSAGHTQIDVPRALASAGFSGPVLPPFIASDAVPALIAASLARQDEERYAA
jgi:sirohydrochlorin ferrochelatase